MKRAMILGLAALLLLGACNRYSTSSRDRSLRGNVHIPILRNDTSQAGLELELTERIVEAIERDGLLTILPSEEDADFLLRGSIVSYDERASYTGASGFAEEYQLSLAILMDFEVLDRAGNPDAPEDWNRTLRSQASFYLEDTDAGETLTREEAEEQVRLQIIEDILNAIFGDW